MAQGAREGLQLEDDMETNVVMTSSTLRHREPQRRDKVEPSKDIHADVR